MEEKFSILAINGSASQSSSNLGILQNLKKQINSPFVRFEIVDDLSVFPHFQTALTDKNTPKVVSELRKKIQKSHAVIISTPEYVFSIPSGLKNILEWCVSTTVFQQKPLVLVTAAANGVKAHEELKLIMQTIEGDFDENTTLLISGIKGKINAEGEVSNEKLSIQLKKLVSNFLNKTGIKGINTSISK